MFRKSLVILLFSTVLAVAASAAPAVAGEPSGGKPDPKPGSKGSSVAVTGRFTNFISQGGAGVHICPNNTCTVLTYVDRGLPVTDYCYVSGQQLPGSFYWDAVYVDGKAGWINEAWLTSQTQAQLC